MNQVYVYPHRGRFQDIDAAGILFFARNFDYFHDAYLAFLEHLEMPLHEHLDGAEFVIPLVHAEADFAKPIRFGTRCDVHRVVDCHILVCRDQHDWWEISPILRPVR